MYILKNAWRSISRAKVRNILISVIVLVIATSSCGALSIREVSGTAKQQYLEDMEVTAQISIDRQSMMQGFSSMGGGRGDQMSGQKPGRIGMQGDGQLIAYVRVGNESVPADPIKLRELVLKGSGETYDSLRSKYEFSNMSFTKLKSVYKQRTGNSFEDTDYESFGLIDEKGNLTNAGALLADESPVRHSRLFCTRWNVL